MSDGMPRLLTCCSPGSWSHDVEGDRTYDFADDSALHECDESRGTRYSERHSAQIDAFERTRRGRRRRVEVAAGIRRGSRLRPKEMVEGSNLEHREAVPLMAC